VVSTLSIASLVWRSSIQKRNSCSRNRGHPAWCGGGAQWRIAWLLLKSVMWLKSYIHKWWTGRCWNWWRNVNRCLCWNWRQQQCYHYQYQCSSIRVYGHVSQWQCLSCNVHLWKLCTGEEVQPVAPADGNDDAIWCEDGHLIAISLLYDMVLSLCVCVGKTSVHMTFDRIGLT